MDDALWEYGKKAASLRDHVDGWELDFLRGMHETSALTELASTLTATTGQNVRLMSVWLDKTAWVSWTDSSDNPVVKRELADLAVIVRRENGSAIRSWMWLMQAKRTGRLLEGYHGESSEHELDLLHRMPQFKLLNANESFDLASEFCVTKSLVAAAPWNCEVSTPWTFLDFDADRHAPQSAAASGYSPVAPRWTGCTPSKGTWAEEWRLKLGYQHPAINSYTRCLEAIVKGSPIPWVVPGQLGPEPAFLPGAPVEEQFPEWSRLYDSLISSLGSKSTGHAGLRKGEKGEAVRLSEFVNGGSAALANGARHFDEFWLGNTLAYGTIPLDGGSSFSWAQTIGWPDWWKATERFDEALRATFGGSPGANEPPIADYDNESRGMQVLMLDVLGEIRSG